MLKSTLFILLFVAMFCSGAAEIAMSQWASLFAEIGLNVSKTTGDLLGPCFFAILMGVSRVLFLCDDRLTKGVGIISAFLYHSHRFSLLTGSIVSFLAAPPERSFIA